MSPIERLRLLVLSALCIVVAGGFWRLAGRRLQLWARDTEAEPWFAPMPGLPFSLMPVTWQGWLVALGILALTFTLGMLGAAGLLGPPHHLGSR